MQENFSKLLTYSYNIVGSYEDAKDLVQDVLEKYISLDKSHIQDETNFLIKSTINHSLNFKKRHRKKEIFGEWLPEPVSLENAEINLIKEQTANYTLLVLMENLTPKERAVFILKEGFAYSHQDISELLDMTPESSRKLLSRAHATLKNVRFETEARNSALNMEVLQKYQQALSAANIEELEALLIKEIRLTADGGKKVRVVKAVEVGRKATATLLSYIQHQFLNGKKATLHHLNHQPAICFWHQEKVYNCQILKLDATGKIERVYSIVDPEKLKMLK